MSGYIEAGYLIALGSLASYATSLIVRERAARSALGQDKDSPVRQEPDTGSTAP